MHRRHTPIRPRREHRTGYEIPNHEPRLLQRLLRHPFQPPGHHALPHHGLRFPVRQRAAGFVAAVADNHVAELFAQVAARGRGVRVVRVGVDEAVGEAGADCGGGEEGGERGDEEVG